ncbi:MAG TPA: type 1 glutamine amidotransferase [Lacipirellulaceae bacterium]|jgi:GMP synthase (glutamine-hydrolysing)|nr:type 1 glutamine amidotransferase [Lacipirellulaceae bacterium]
MGGRVRYLLLQTRNAGDPMAAQEVRCFARALGCDPGAIEVFDLLNGAPTRELLSEFDILLLGGSGHYSAACKPGSETPPWLARTLDCLREIHESARPTFASCWGFQAMARALGGECINDQPNAEIGTIELTLTAAGRGDPVFGSLPAAFSAQAGHEDHVVALPNEAVLLAASALVPQQAFCVAGKPIYCTQFHPELDRAAMLERAAAYPEYVQRIAGISYEQFALRVRETPESNLLLRQFVDHVLK